MFKLASAAPALLLAAAAGAQSAPVAPPPSPSAAEREILKVADDLNAAWLRHDAAALDKLVADDFRGITGSGKSIRKADLIGYAMRSEETSTDLSDRTVRVFGDVAVATNRITDRGRKANGETFTVVSYVTSVLVRRPAGWQVVAEQETIPKK